MVPEVVLMVPLVVPIEPDVVPMEPEVVPLVERVPDVVPEVLPMVPLVVPEVVMAPPVEPLVEPVEPPVLPEVVWAKAVVLRPVANRAAIRILVVFMVWNVKMWKGRRVERRLGSALLRAKALRRLQKIRVFIPVKYLISTIYKTDIAERLRRNSFMAGLGE
jgi:hypothetical protein